MQHNYMDLYKKLIDIIAHALFKCIEQNYEIADQQLLLDILKNSLIKPNKSCNGDLCIRFFKLSKQFKNISTNIEPIYNQLTKILDETDTKFINFINIIHKIKIFNNKEIDFFVIPLIGLILLTLVVIFSKDDKLTPIKILSW